MSRADIGELRVSHPDKVFFPDVGLTKRDVVEHYHHVGALMVEHLRGRPLTMRRFPDGIDEQGWFQKEASAHFPDWVRVAEVPRRGGEEPVHHVVCDDLDTLVYLADQACIEFHVGLSTVDDLEHPDLMVVDLDPPDGTPVRQLRELARRVRDRYTELGLGAFVQATGGRGFHVVAALDGSADFAVTRELAATIADRLAAEYPERLTTEQRKNQRGDRVFLDVNRNGYGQTFVAPYSLRARPGAPVVTPLDWDELGRAEPNGWHPRRMRQRLAHKADPWRALHQNPASASAALARLRESSEA